MKKHLVLQIKIKLLYSVALKFQITDEKNQVKSQKMTQLFEQGM